jgi:hypothetical protein
MSFVVDVSYILRPAAPRARQNEMSSTSYVVIRKSRFTVLERKIPK